MEVAKKGSHALPPDDHSENLHAAACVPFWRKKTPDRFVIEGFQIFVDIDQF